MARAFVIRPFGKKKNSKGEEIDFERVHEELIAPALQATDLGGGTTGNIIDQGNIRADMFALILEADVVICDMTLLNVNVFYELGIRHALRKKRTILIKGKPGGDKTPFDLLTDRYTGYSNEDPAASKDDLVKAIRATLASDRETDSPIFEMLPSLREADPSGNLIVPVDFREEVARAAAAKRKGWLRLLSEEVRVRRFEWEGLKLIGKAQWHVKDCEGARDSWEAVREVHPNDVDANLALASIYERLYRSDPRPKWIEYSDQAIDRVLAEASTTTKTQRVEALSLKGRNQKSRWRLEFESLDSVEERRKTALTRALLRSADAYLDAYRQDLNHFYPGLNALQMVTIALDLAQDKDAWYDVFDSDAEADDAREELGERAAALRALVPMGVEASLANLPDADEERIWAEISAADLLFLKGERKGRVASAYRDAIPPDKAFAWDAARGQLRLFADLGIQQELALDVIDEINARFPDDDPKPDKQVHLVLFGGHQIDAPDRDEPRFPADQEERARALIATALKKTLDDEHEVHGLASASPGADILAHEICAELGVKTTICLPMPVKEAARVSFEGFDEWRNRFLELAADDNVLVLSDREGLPHWLEPSGLDPWERGNRWVMKMAETWGAARVSLIALWDGKEKGDAPGGTAQLVQLARDSGMVLVEPIDAGQLLD